MGDLAIWLFQQTALDLLMRPLGEEDVWAREEPLWEPMYEGERWTSRV